MGLFYLANCLALATGPHVLVYRSSGMKENDAFWKCFKSGMLYGLTQLLKFFLATLIPHDVEGSQKNILYMECLSVLLDLVFIYSIVRRSSSRNEFNVLVAGMGWSTAALVSTKYVPIWFGTRGVEFDIKYLSLSYEANLDMLLTFVLFYVLWLLVRKQGSLFSHIVGLMLLICASLRQIVFTYVDYFIQPFFKTLVLKTAIAVSMGLITLLLRESMKTDKVNTASGVSMVWKSITKPFYLAWTHYISPALGLKPHQDSRAPVPSTTKRHN